jgi:dihydroorotase
MLLLGLSVVQTGSAATYDLLLKGGHVIDARNGVSAVRDVAIKDGRIAAVSPAINPATALKTHPSGRPVELLISFQSVSAS